MIQNTVFANLTHVLCCWCCSTGIRLYKNNTTIRNTTKEELRFHTVLY